MPVDRGRPALVVRSTCRGCGGANLEEILALGPSPLANAFLRSPAEFAAEERYPLDLYFCHDCSLFQLIHVVDPDILFRHYLYVTGTSTTIAAHNRQYAATVAGMQRFASGDLVVEIASNDGSLLRCFQAHGPRTLGIEPAENLAALATASGVPTVNRFFNSATAADVLAEYGPARAIAANNVFAHVDDPGDFLAGCRVLLAEDGVATIEVPYVGELIERLEYDTVYHEHLSYFSIRSVTQLASRVGLSLVRIDKVPVHGGSLRLYLSRAATPLDDSVQRLAAEEAAAGLTSAARYRAFARAVQQGRADLVTLIERLVAQGQRVAGYGAPAKGNTLLNYCGLDTRLLPYTVDKNPLKVGLFTPGMHIPVRAVSALSDPASRPDYVLILAWNFADEIMHQERAHRERGGRFILPVPRPEVV